MPGAPSIFLFLVAMPGAPSSFLSLVVRPGATSSFLLLVAMTFVPSSVLAPRILRGWEKKCRYPLVIETLLGFRPQIQSCPSTRAPNPNSHSPNQTRSKHSIDNKIRTRNIKRCRSVTKKTTHSWDSCSAIQLKFLQNATNDINQFTVLIFTILSVPFQVFTQQTPFNLYKLSLTQATLKPATSQATLKSVLIRIIHAYAQPLLHHSGKRLCFGLFALSVLFCRSIETAT